MSLETDEWSLGFSLTLRRLLMCALFKALTCLWENRWIFSYGIVETSYGIYVNRLATAVPSIASCLRRS